MTSAPRAWERPDGTDDDPRVEILASTLRSYLYAEATVYNGNAERIPQAARDLLARLDAGAPVTKSAAWPVTGSTVPTQAALDALPKDTWVRGNDTAEAVKRGPGAGGGWYLPAVDRLAHEALLLPAVITAVPDVPAQPTEAPDVQRAADGDGDEPCMCGTDSTCLARHNTRGILAAQLDEALFYTAPDGTVVFRWMDSRVSKADEPLLDGLPFRMADVALGVLRGGGADGGGEDEEPNLAHRSAVDTAKLSGPDTRSLLLCTRDGRVGGAATIGDSRLNASIVWAMLGNGGTPDDVHRSYPWCSVEDAAVLDRLRLDVVEHLDEDEDVDPVADYDANAGPCPRCGHEIDLRTVCHVCHRLPSSLHEAKARTELPEPSGQCDVCSAPLYNVCARLDDDGKACSARCVDLHRLARAAGVSPDSEDPVGAIEAAIRELNTGRVPTESDTSGRRNALVRYRDVDGDALTVFTADIPGHGDGVNIRADHAGCSIPSGDLGPFIDALTEARGGTVVTKTGDTEPVFAAARADSSGPSADELDGVLGWLLGAGFTLYRAPASTPAPLTVGEVVDDAADLDRRATVGTVVEDKHGVSLARRMEPTRMEISGVLCEWLSSGDWSTTSEGLVDFPVTVVRVGTGGGES